MTDTDDFTVRVAKIVGDSNSKPALNKSHWNSLRMLADDQGLRAEELFRTATGHFDQRVEAIRAALLRRGCNAPDSSAGTFHYRFKNGASASAALELCGLRIYFRTGMPFQSRSYMEAIAYCSGGPVYNFRTSRSENNNDAQGELSHEPPPSIPQMEQNIDDHMLLFLNNLMQLVRIDVIV